MRRITFVITIVTHLLLSSFLIAISSCTSITPTSVTSKLDSIISDSTNVIKTNPRDADAYVKRGSAYAAKRQLNRAISDFNKALEINPMNNDAYYNRGLAYSRIAEYNQAISDFNKALEINPKDAWVYYDKAVVCERVGLKKDALEAYKGCIQYASPTFFAPYLKQARRMVKKLEGR